MWGLAALGAGEEDEFISRAQTTAPLSGPEPLCALSEQEMLCGKFCFGC